MTDCTVITAAFVAPMDQPILRDGAIAFADGRILSVGQRDEVVSSHRNADIIDADRSIILPGLINAHTHLELSACNCGDAPASFTGWILSIPQRLAQVCDDRNEAFARGVREGIAQCLRFGVTAIGDTSQQFHITRPILRESPLRAVSYGEALGLGGARQRFERLMGEAVRLDQQTDRLRIGLTPHAPYTVDRLGYEQCVSVVRPQRLPLATHLAETPEESEFLLHQTGAFRELWEGLGQWRDDIPLAGLRPVPFAQIVGLLDYPTLLAHVNYCEDGDLRLLAQSQASVVWCPRTHRYFGHPPHRWRDMLQAGINVAVGTDSCASSPDLNLLDDLRLVRRQSPDVPAQTLFELVTTRAAKALQWSDQLGSLTSGKCADMAVFPAEGLDPMETLLNEPILPSQVWIGGQCVVG